jgi:hypothetical protein
MTSRSPYKNLPRRAMMVDLPEPPDSDDLVSKWAIL